MKEASEFEARTGTALQSLLDLENDAPDVLREVLPGATAPFWSQVRMRIAWMLSAQRSGSVAAAIGTWNRWHEARRLARSHLPSRWDAVRKTQPHDVCFYVSGGTLVRDGDVARNWLVDDFAQTAEDAIVVQQHPLPAKMGRPGFTPTLSMDAANARLSWRARGKRPPAATTRAIETLLSEFANRLGQPHEHFTKIAQRATRDETLRPYQLEELQRLLDRVRPRLVVFDNGSYTYHGESVGLMKDAGAYVVEPQHGWIGPSHAAYNYGRVFDEPAFRRILPDELLTFGAYWSKSIRHPGRVTAIGKPHLERQASTAPAIREQRVLVVSSRTSPERTDAFVIGLRDLLADDWLIAFRPHPGERSETQSRYPRLSAHDGVTVDLEPDVYESLKRSTAVVGEASTVLFEARAFGCEVVARDSAFAETVIGDLFGARASEPAQVARRLQDIGSADSPAASVDRSIWAPNPQETFADWLRDRRRELNNLQQPCFG